LVLNILCVTYFVTYVLKHCCAKKYRPK